jgi:hypothetical protein
MFYMHHGTAVNVAVWGLLGGIAAIALSRWIFDNGDMEAVGEMLGILFVLAGIGLLIAALVGIVNLSLA